jgi:hypothetical protein
VGLAFCMSGVCGGWEWVRPMDIPTRI